MYREERISDEFTKFHLNHNGNWPFSPVVHKFTAPDSSEWNDAHDHPWDFTSHVLRGGYTERVYEVEPNGSWISYDVFRAPGTSHKVHAEHCHRIIDLPEGECWTLVIAGPDRRKTHFWKFTEGGAFSRPYDRDEFEKV